MEVRKLKIPEVLEIIPPKFEDHRGFFSETYSQSKFAQQSVNLSWVQDNHSYSRAAGVLRGLHYQAPPLAQDKLVRVVRGSIFDVAVDIRQGSPSFGKWVSLIVSAKSWNQILVPKGFAHGFLTLEPDCEVIYKVSAPYSAAHDRAIRYDDPVIGIDWPKITESPVISEKDAAAPLLRETDSGFTYEAERTRS
jgi:dTDP-4-dehydrorhamnose 3,5-epimerase